MFRTYVWGDQPQRLPQDWYKRAYPEFANTRQKIVTVFFEDGRWRASGSPTLDDFDADGRFDGAAAADHAMAALEASERAKPADVPPRVDLIRKAERKRDASRWQLSQADEVRITADLAGTSPIPRYRAPTPVTPKMDHRQFRDALKAAGLKQKELAARLGLDLQTVNRWATDKLPVPQYVAAYFDALSENKKLLAELAAFYHVHAFEVAERKINEGDQP